MKTLQIIQTVSKIGKILSKIVFVFCIVGFCLCIVGILSTAIGAPVLKLGGVTLESILQAEADMSMGSLYAAMATCAIICAGEAVLAEYAGRYFTRELSDGTPFTFDGAQQLLQLGVLSICIPVGMQIIVRIVQVIFEKTMTNVVTQTPEMAGSVTLGVMVIVLAIVCKYGAEQAAENAAGPFTQQIPEQPAQQPAPEFAEYNSEEE